MQKKRIYTRTYTIQCVGAPAYWPAHPECILAKENKNKKRLESCSHASTSTGKCLLSSTDNLRNGMADSRTSLLRLLLGQTACDADFEGGGRLPSSVSGVETEAERERLESGDENAVCETLGIC